MVIIRPATLQDLPNVLNLLASMSPETDVYNPEYTAIVIRNALTTQDDYSYVAVDKDAIIGCVFLYDDMDLALPGRTPPVIVSSLAVSDQYRRRGIASNLVKTILRHHFVKRQIREVQARAAETNLPSRLLFGQFAEMSIHDQIRHRFIFRWTLTNQPWLSDST